MRNLFGKLNKNVVNVLTNLVLLLKIDWYKFKNLVIYIELV